MIVVGSIQRRARVFLRSGSAYCVCKQEEKRREEKRREEKRREIRR